MTESKVKFFTLFEPPESEALEVPQEDYCVEATEQTHRDSDLNMLVKRYNLGDKAAMCGVDKTPVFGDFSRAATYEDSKQAVIDADRQFMSLPAEVRAKFNNNAGKLIAWLGDPANFDEAIALGLLVKPDGYRTPAERAELQKEYELMQKVEKQQGEKSGT